MNPTEDTDAIDSFRRRITTDRARAGYKVGRDWALESATYEELRNIAEMVHGPYTWLEIRLPEGHSLLEFTATMDRYDRLNERGDILAREDPYRREIAAGAMTVFKSLRSQL